jgi:hypothetical protein
VNDPTLQTGEHLAALPPIDPNAVDAPTDRPGVPMEAKPGHPSGAHWHEPSHQVEGARLVLHRTEVEEPTPVFGTAQPPRGLSGALRRRAYRIPERFARHWLLLLAADRVDVLEARVGSAIARPLERLGMNTASEQARLHPLPMAAGMAAGGLAVGMIYREVRRRSH